VDSSTATFRDGHREGRIRWVSVYVDRLESFSEADLVFGSVVVVPRYVCPTHIDAISSVLTKLVGGLDLIREYPDGLCDRLDERLI